MSGGSLNYFYAMLQDHIGDFEDKELDELVKDLAKLFRDREWYLSSDTCVGDWNEARDAFKAKWFTEIGRQDRIEAYLAELSEEVRKSFGISERYCKNCKHWSIEAGYDQRYGRCAIDTRGLYHKSYSCKKWERR